VKRKCFKKGLHFSFKLSVILKMKIKRKLLSSTTSPVVGERRIAYEADHAKKYYFNAQKAQERG
jgi:hypothetical protein